MNAQEIIQLLQLEPLPEEGGYFRRTYESAERVAVGALPPRYQQDMLMGTAIYALFTPTDFSAMHRLNTDEVYHFYAGDPLEMLLLYPDGSGQTILLGNDLSAGMQPQFVAPRDAWQGSIVAPTIPAQKSSERDKTFLEGDTDSSAETHGFSLIGTTMAPGYEQSSFELGDLETLLAQYPHFAEPIRQRMRE